MRKKIKNFFDKIQMNIRIRRRKLFILTRMQAKSFFLILYFIEAKYQFVSP